MTVTPFVNPFDPATALQPDFDTIFNTLQTQVTNDGDTQKIWTDAITAATGVYVLRMVSSFTADLSFAVERAQHEVMLATARRPTSIYAATRMQGVHLQRKIPGGVEVRLARSIQAGQPAVVQIPAYTQWFVGGVSFFNRTEIIFPAGVQLLTTTLYRGTITTETVTSSGLANQSFLINVDNFQVSNNDIFCVINGVTWEPTFNGLWQENMLSQVFQDDTTVDGMCRITFGDGVYGAIPPAGTFTVNYVIVQTSDYDASLDLNPAPVGSKVSTAYNTNVAGLTLGAISGIQDELSVNFYQANAPYIASGRKGANNRNNMRGWALAYPGVIDVRLLGQAEINPKDVRWMTGVGVALLTSVVWGNADWNQFVAYLQSNSDSARHFYQLDVEQINVPITVKAICAKRANVSSVEQQIVTTILNFFALQAGSLGAQYSMDILAADILAATVDPYGNLITNLNISNPDVTLTALQYASTSPSLINVTATIPTQPPRIVSGVNVPNGQIGYLG